MMAPIRQLSIVWNPLTERTALVPSAAATGKVVSSSVESESRNRLLGRVTSVEPPRTPADTLSPHWPLGPHYNAGTCTKTSHHTNKQAT